MKKMICVRLEDTLWRKVKAQAAIEGKDIQDWLSDLLNRTIEKKEGKK